jgi:hypothetical protein
VAAADWVAADRVAADWVAADWVAADLGEKEWGALAQVAVGEAAGLAQKSSQILPRLLKSAEPGAYRTAGT